jgi:hypothetical protein
MPEAALSGAAIFAILHAVSRTQIRSLDRFAGAYRFGHSMIRPSYRANRIGNPGTDPGAPAFFGMIFDPAGEGKVDPVDLRGGARKPRRFIGWETFFDFGLLEVGSTLAVVARVRAKSRASSLRSRGTLRCGVLGQQRGFRAQAAEAARRSALPPRPEMMGAETAVVATENLHHR